MARNSSSNRSSGTKSRAKANAMTPQEAGHLGGLKGGNAPHRCRGFQCQKESSKR